MKNVLLLAEGTDDCRAAHALVEVTVDGAPERAAYLVKLAVSVGKEGHDLAEDEPNDVGYTYGTERQHDGELTGWRQLVFGVGETLSKREYGLVKVIGDTM